MKFKIRFADQIVGTFVLVAIVGVAVILIFIGINQRWFARNYTFASSFPSGEGLAVGMPVMLQGFEIGKVSRIALTEENEVDIEFYVQDTYYDKVLPYSVLELVSSPIGLGTSLKFHRGKGKGRPLPEHSLVPSLNSEEGKEYVENDLVEMPKSEDIIGSVIEKVNPILDDTRNTLAQVKKLVTDVDLALMGKSGPIGGMVNDLALTPTRINRAIDKVSDTVDTVTARVDTITGDVGRITDQTTDILTRIDSVSKNLEDISANLKVTSEGLRDTKGLATRLIDPKGSISSLLDDNNTLYNQVDAAIKSLNQIVAQIKSFVDYVNGARPQISNLLEKGNTTLDQGKDVLEAVKNNPLLKGGIPEKKAQGPTLKSYRDEDF